MDDDWDLHAVVRGCRGVAVSSPVPSAEEAGRGAETDPFAIFSHLLLQEDEQLLCFPDVLATQTSIQELEELCKPFYSKASSPLSPKPRSGVSASSPISALKTHQKQHQPQRSSKRRKNQQKRVVCEVPAEGLSDDMWAWRKYGQKPIKGSPYPRGYYRCSSSKGCLARKQVERSRSDPTMFIITYTAEHNHPRPTHRNSLAGSTRHKYSPDPQPPPTKSSTSGASSLSPTTPLTASMEEDDFMLQQQLLNVKQEGETEDDDMFMDLEELHEPTSTSSSFDDCLSDHFSSPPH